MITLAFFSITLFLELVSPRVDPTIISIARSLYIVLYIVYFLYSLVKWSKAVKPDDNTSRDIKVSPGYPALFAIALLIEAVVCVVVTRTSGIQKAITVVMILSIVYAVLFLFLQIIESIDKKAHFSAIYMILFCKEVSAVLIIIGLPFAILGTVLQFIIMLISLPLHLFKVPVYVLTPKRTLLWRLLTL